MSFEIFTCCLSRAYTAMKKANKTRLYAVHVQPLHEALIKLRLDIVWCPAFRQGLSWRLKNLLWLSCFYFSTTCFDKLWSSPCFPLPLHLLPTPLLLPPWLVLLPGPTPLLKAEVCSFCSPLVATTLIRGA